ncbi:MAG: hypothetical protein P1V81_08665 [Planctomycetota bacterium]|nr:hypothetical protein [Planctomycetota bacterium]
MSDSSPPPKRSTKRRVAFALGYLGFLLVLLEAGAWSFLALGGMAAGFDEQVAGVLGQADALERPVGGSRQGAATVATEELHPYLGFTPKLMDTGAAGNELYQVWQQRLFEPGSPLHSTDPTDLVVGITGGSVAEQFGQFGGAKQLAGLLGQTPRFGGRRVRFVGFAFGGVKQPQQLMGLNYLLAIGGRLDLVINLDGFNEVALHESDNQPQGVALSYPRAWFHRIGRAETLVLVGQRRILQDERMRAARAVLESPLRHSGLRRLVWVLADESLREEIEQLGEELRSYEVDAEAKRTALGPRSSAADELARLDELVGIWQRASLQMHRLCEASGIEYYHFLQPNQYVAGSKTLSEAELKLAFRPGQGYGRLVPEGYPRLQAAADGLVLEGVRYHDLTEVFRDVEETVYKDNCCHVNALGNQLLAAAIREAIVSWGD